MRTEHRARCGKARSRGACPRAQLAAARKIGKEGMVRRRVRDFSALRKSSPRASRPSWRIAPPRRMAALASLNTVEKPLPHRLNPFPRINPADSREPPPWKALYHRAQPSNAPCPSSRTRSTGPRTASFRTVSPSRGRTLEDSRAHAGAAHVTAPRQRRSRDEGERSDCVQQPPFRVTHRPSTRSA